MHQCRPALSIVRQNKPPPLQKNAHIGQRGLRILPGSARHAGLRFRQPGIRQRLPGKHRRQQRACGKGAGWGHSQGLVKKARSFLGKHQRKQRACGQEGRVVLQRGGCSRTERGMASCGMTRITATAECSNAQHSKARQSIAHCSTAQHSPAHHSTALTHAALGVCQGRLCCCRRPLAQLLRFARQAFRQPKLCCL